ncbi:hypothetical protein GYMLUDRAFT_254404 [Collybiopsis luxurians FD-317 M1]|nr:hypothetical protein GYMLUDRAFT_254404 [Collybiopsis luxurians FD-317 M1]
MLSLFIILAALAVEKTLADPTDFVNPDYVLQHSKDPSTSSARDRIMHNARVAAAKGPWSKFFTSFKSRPDVDYMRLPGPSGVSNDNGVTPPSGDPRDYLSWAPYHWPNCNWCSSGRTHVTNGNGRNETDDEPDNPHSDSDLDPGEDMDDYTAAWSSHEDHLSFALRHNRMLRLRRSLSSSQGSSSTSPTATFMLDSINDDLPAPQAPFDTLVSRLSFFTSSLPTATSQSVSRDTSRSFTAFYAAAETKKSSSKSSCSPSPTKSMPPSATWTTCPYVVRDGKVNPDVRTLRGAGAINLASDAVLSSAQAYVFTEDAQYGQTVVSTLEALLFDPKTGMNPNMNFGQVVRGPGKQTGSWTGPLDLRGLAKIVNGMIIFRKLEGLSSRSLEKRNIWSPEIDQKMRTWMIQYLEWLTTSPIGKKARSRPNNHSSFYHYILASLYLGLDRRQEAKSALDEYFYGPFKEQIAKSGEQPFEAVRTRPMHYRSFNLEAMIAMAKLGDYIGQNYWDMETRHGSTMKDAIDFLMSVDPKKETNVIPQIGQHVAAAQAAYGPSKKYTEFLEQLDVRNQPYWYYDQSSAFNHAPGSKSRKRSAVVWRREDDDGGIDGFNPECPDYFKEELRVEIDIDIYVTCPDLLPFILSTKKNL